jgi:hypothetical protein
MWARNRQGSNERKGTRERVERGARKGNRKGRNRKEEIKEGGREKWVIEYVKEEREGDGRKEWIVGMEGKWGKGKGGEV